MKWNWQRVSWPNFRYNSKALEEFEKQFLYHAGILLGEKKHLSENDSINLKIELLLDEAMTTSEIEGEHLDRNSVHSSICNALGLKRIEKKTSQAERGVANLMVASLINPLKTLTHEMLFTWHELIMQGSNLQDIGCYRTKEETMQIISYGKQHEPILHFEAPPHQILHAEMDRFIKWFNREPSSLIKSGLAHLYFISIHPFEDGNGRIARTLAHMSLPDAQVIALSHRIMENRSGYYSALERNNKDLEVTDWLVFFAREIMAAQSYTKTLVGFTIAKTKFYDRAKGLLNDRQAKVVERIFKEGLKGFQGELSAENYITITGTSKATTTRDLQDLIEKSLMSKTGHLKSTRYSLKF